MQEVVMSKVEELNMLLLKIDETKMQIEQIN
jgi:hypothetical protein